MKSRAVLLLMALASTPGCYLAHVTGGQTRLLWERRPVAEVMQDPATPEALRRKLEVVEAARQHAAALGLDVGGQYTSYVAWPGDRIVTSVVATRPGEVEPAGFWFMAPVSKPSARRSSESVPAGRAWSWPAVSSR